MKQEPSLLTALLIFVLLSGLSACEQIGNRLGFESPAEKAARVEAEGKAVGGGCRQSGRAIEDCYAIYTWLPMDAIYAGWREMDEYMRENNLETVTPQLPPVQDPRKKKKKPAPAPEGDGQTAEPSAETTENTTVAPDTVAPESH